MCGCHCSYIKSVSKSRKRKILIFPSCLNICRLQLWLQALSVYFLLNICFFSNRLNSCLSPTSCHHFSFNNFRHLLPLTQMLPEFQRQKQAVKLFSEQLWKDRKFTSNPADFQVSFEWFRTVCVCVSFFCSFKWNAVLAKVIGELRSAAVLRYLLPILIQFQCSQYTETCTSGTEIHLVIAQHVLLWCMQAWPLLDTRRDF